jgi:hypothetical protein
MSDLPPSNLPPPPPGYAPPPAPPAQPPPGYAPPPPGYQGQMAPGMPMIAAAGGLSIGAQIIAARSSIIVGVIGIFVPIVTVLVTGGTVVYFYILPIFGVIYGIRAMTRGAVIGGGIGVVLNLVAGLVTLVSSGLLGL